MNKQTKKILLNSQLGFEAIISEKLASVGFSVSSPVHFQLNNGEDKGRVSIRASKWKRLEGYGFIVVELNINCLNNGQVAIFPSTHKTDSIFPYISLANSNLHGHKLLVNAIKQFPQELHNKSIFSDPPITGNPASVNPEKDTELMRIFNDCIESTRDSVFRSSLKKSHGIRVALVSVPIVIANCDIVRFDIKSEDISKCEDAIVTTGEEKYKVAFPSTRLYSKGYFLKTIDKLGKYIDVLLEKLVCTAEFEVTGMQSKILQNTHNTNDKQENKWRRLMIRIKQKIVKYARRIPYKPHVGLLIVIVLFIIYINIYNILPKQTSDHVIVFASLALVWVTISYAYAAYQTMNELRIQRLDSFKPVLVLRYLYSNLDASGSFTQNTKLSTRLVNVGAGPALNINVKSNIVFDQLGNIQIGEYQNDMVFWPNHNHAFGVSLGPDSSNENLQICFMSMDYQTQYYTPINDPGAIMEITYDDIFGRTFMLRFENCRQEISKPSEK